MKRSITTLGVIAAGLLGACSNVSQQVNPPAEKMDFTQTQRLCDIPMTWGYKQLPADVASHYGLLQGLWTGTVHFQGSELASDMCIAVAVQDIHADGMTNSMFNWNLGNAIASANMVSVGQSNWWAQTVVLYPEKGEQLLFASDKPYRDSNGLWYRYELDMPTAGDPNVIRGYLHAYRHGSATDASVQAWHGTIQKFPVKLVRQPTAVAKK